MAGGGKAMKIIWNTIYNEPVNLFIIGGLTLGFWNLAATSRVYHREFGKFDFERKE